MKNDPIIAEIRKIRDRLAAKFNYNIEAILRDAQTRERESGHEIVKLKPRRPKHAQHRRASGRNKSAAAQA